jgi:plasmid stabilization system protein ParE
MRYADCGDEEAEGYAGDLQVAYDYYKCDSSTAAEQFLAAFLRATEVIQSTPYACRLRRHGWRQMIVPGHPNFSIFYKELPQCWLVAGIVSNAADPDTIQVRLLIREVGEEPA